MTKVRLCGLFLFEYSGIGSSCLLFGRNQQMHVIGHEYAGMHQALITERRLLQCVYIKRLILLLKERGLPINTPRYDMLRDAGDEVARLAGHTCIVGIRFSSGRVKKMRFYPTYEN